METFSGLVALYKGNHRSPVDSPHKGMWRRALMFTLICVRTFGWSNNKDIGDLRRHPAHYDVTVMVYAGSTLDPHNTESVAVYLESQHLSRFLPINTFVLVGVISGNEVISVQPFGCVGYQIGCRISMQWGEHGEFYVYDTTETKTHMA